MALAERRTLLLELANALTPYRDLQAIAKCRGIKANLKKADLLSALNLEADADNDKDNPAPVAVAANSAFMPPKRKRHDEAASAATTPTNERLRSIIATHTCAITHDLIVDPVIAEDGHVYEKKAITRWLATHSTSPKTNTPMGKSLVSSVSARQTIADLMEINDVVDDEAAAAWYFAMGMVAVAAPDNDVALERFERAAELGHAEAQLQIEGFALKRKVDEFHRRASEAGSDVSHIFSSVTGGTMTAWKPLRAGVSVVRILEDVEEVRRLCERPAPGADRAVGWAHAGASRKMSLCGQVCTVISSHASCFNCYRVAPPNGDTCLPFDACILIHE